MSAFPVIIVAPPPTPNGDLHVGHLSGPYFGADVLRRYLALRGIDTVSALSVDLNQSYVVTTAERLGKDPIALAKASYGEICTTLSRAGIEFDVIGIPDSSYAQYVSDWFLRLYKAGKLRARNRKVPFDVQRNRFMFESYGSGFCPTCLAATKANICETCGHPNEAHELLGLYPTGGNPGDQIEMREIQEYYLNLEELREPLLNHLRLEIIEKRPSLARLIDEIFAFPLPDFPVTFPSNWGVHAPFPDAEGLVLNVWAEMVAGHYYWINTVCTTRGRELLVNREHEVKYVQYLGFDNSFFYVIAHLALALTARHAGLEAIMPSSFLTNEFYFLDNFKFSTSQGHLIWARDLLNEFPVDEIRFYLAWSNPEYNQANFNRADLCQIVSLKFREPMARLTNELPLLAKQGKAVSSQYSKALLARFEAAFGEQRQSLRIAALTISNGFNLLTKLIDQGIEPSVLCGIAQAIASGMAPIAPEAAQRLWIASGAEEPVRWPEAV